MLEDCEVTYKKAVLSMSDNMGDAGQGSAALIGYLLVRECLRSADLDRAHGPVGGSNADELRSELLNIDKSGALGVFAGCSNELDLSLGGLSNTVIDGLISAAREAVTQSVTELELRDFVSILKEDDRVSYYLTDDVSTLLLEMLPQPSGGRILCPSPASLPLAVLAARKGWCAVVLGLQDWLASLVQTLSNGAVQTGRAIEDSEIDQLGSFDAVVGVLPIGEGNNESLSEIQVLESVLRKLSDSGRAVILTRGGFVTSASRKFKKVKKALVDGALLGVICLPAVFSRSMAKGMVLVFEKREATSRQTLRMLSADKEGNVKRVPFKQKYVHGASRRRVLANSNEIVAVFNGNESDLVQSRDVPVQEIEEQGFCLDPLRYIRPMQTFAHGLTLNALDEIVDIIRPQTLRVGVDQESDDATQQMSALEIGLADVMPSGEISRRLAKRIDFAGTRGALSRLNEQCLHTMDVLLCYKGKIGLVGVILDEIGHTPWTASQSFLVLRPKKEGPGGMTAEALFLFLKSPYAQNWLSSHSTSQAVPIISISDLRKMPVPLISDEMFKATEKTFAEYLKCHDQIQRLKAHAESLVSGVFEAKTSDENGG